MLINLRNALMTGKRLPGGYNRVEYVKSTGTQFVDTGYFSNNTSYFRMDCEILSCGGSCGLFGARNVTESYGRGPAWKGYGSLGIFVNGSFKLALNDVSYDSGWLTSKPSVSGARRIIEIKDRSIYVDGDFYIKSTNTNSFTCGTSTGLFNTHLKAGSSPYNWQYGSDRKVSVKFYGFTIKEGGENGVLIAEIIPVEKEGIGYLYNLTNSSVLSTEGSGNLIVD